MTTILSDSGLQLASGNIVDLKSTIPVSGNYTAGDIIFEIVTATRISGWKRQTTGSGNVLGTDWVYFSVGNILNAVVPTTSGTSVDITGIPSYAKTIFIMLKGVGTSGVSVKQLQLGNGSPVTTGYNQVGNSVKTSGAAGGTAATSGFQINSQTAAARLYGTIILTLESAATNTWNCIGMTSDQTSELATAFVAGSVTLSSALDRLRLTTVAGTDTFAAGEVALAIGG